MRRSLIYLSVILGAAVVHSCAMDEIVYPEGYGDGYGNSDMEVAGTYLSLDELKDNPLELQSLAGTYVLKVVSEDKWTLTSSEKWCTPDIKKGFKYTRIALSFVDNPWNEDRSAKLQFTLDETGDSFVLDMTQEAAETKLSVNYDKLTFGLPGGETPIMLSTNATEWSYSVTYEQQDASTEWISNDLGEGITTGKGTKNIKIKAKGNGTGTLRNATIVFTAEDKTVQIPVSQAGEFETPEIVLEDNADFGLTWKDIPGVDGYDLEIAKDETFSDKLQTETIQAGTSTYNLSNLTWNNDYIGKVHIRLTAKMAVEGNVLTQTSNAVSAHNYFDENSGDGTEANPYRISKPRHLRNVGKFLEAHYLQTADIDLSGIDFEPICSGLNSTTSIYEGDFTGVYDGDGKSIRNMAINKTANSYCGLFARIGKEGIVRKITMNNPSVKGKAIVGGIAGETLGIIEYCNVIAGDSSIIEGSESTANFAYLGGIAGKQLDGKISHCCNEGISVKGLSGGLGGIVGNVHAFITTVVPNEYTSPVVEYCFNSGEINSDKKTPLGGIVGEVSGGPEAGPDNIVHIQNCHNSGNVHGTQPNNQVGGIAGRTTAAVKINGCSNSGNITAIGSAGGIVGRLGAPKGIKEVRNCFNTGVITSTGNDTQFSQNNNAAGIVATATMPKEATSKIITIENCLNLGEMTAKTGHISGICQFVGDKNNPDCDGKFAMTGSFALNQNNIRQESSSDQYIVTPATAYKNITEEQMKNQATFEGWDFDTVWELTNGKYPTLRSANKQ